MPRLNVVTRALGAACASLCFGATSLAGCDEAEPSAPVPTPEATLSTGEALRAYASDRAFARKALEDSLVTRDNGYARKRLERYTPTIWGGTPIYDPRTAPMLVDAATGKAVPPPAESNAVWSRSLPEPETFDPTDEALRALGERAFFNYPVQPAPGLPEVLDQPSRAGVWTNEGRFGVVWTETTVGVKGAFTCATCHATPGPDGKLVVGLNNPLIDAAQLARGAEAPSWGLGRVDVTSDDRENPAVITDLRPIRWQRRYHRAATLYASPAALAVRIETLIITNNGEAIQPPRHVAAGLAMFLLSLGTATPRSEIAPKSAGSAVFDRTCAGFHAGEGASGQSVTLEEIGTDPEVGLSSERGTGGYRVPSLRGVGLRKPLLNNGAAADLPTLLDPARTTPGHRHGLDLSAEDRAALLEYLAQI